MTITDLPQLVTVDDASRYLKVHASTVSSWCKSGRLPARKVGNRWLIRVIDLAEFVDPTSRPDSDAPLGFPPATGVKGVPVPR